MTENQNPGSPNASWSDPVGTWSTMAASASQEPRDHVSPHSRFVRGILAGSLSNRLVPEQRWPLAQTLLASVARRSTVGPVLDPLESGSNTSGHVYERQSTCFSHHDVSQHGTIHRRSHRQRVRA